MSDDGHKYFFGSMPEMPWKKDMEMLKAEEALKEKAWPKKIIQKIRQIILEKFFTNRA